MIAGERVLAYFDRIGDAPEAMQRLRRFILDLAVRGKLVQQEQSDEPVADLLTRIGSEKARLAKSGEIRKDNPLQPVSGDAEFDVPRTWRWTRLGMVTSYIQRGKSPKYTGVNGALVVSQKCVQWRGLDLAAARRVTWESLADYEDVRFLRDGDLLWNSTGTGTIGRVVRVVEVPEKLVCDSHVTVVRCLEVDPEYVRSWLRSDWVYGLIEGRARGATNQVELTAQLATNQVIPIPPLAEQQRIVVEVDKLMALCDRLESAQKELENRRDRLVSASLARVSHSPDTQSFRESARFHLEHLPRMATSRAHVQQLRQTILNLAVRGRLVAQRADDESAAEALARLAAIQQDQRVGRDWVGALNKPVEAAFRPPSGWAWTRVGAAVDRVTVGYVGPMKDHYVDVGIPFLRSQNVRANRFSGSGLIHISRSFHERILKSALEPGDVVVVRSGNVGTACVIPSSLPEANCSDLVVVKRPRAVIPAYLCFYLNSMAATHIEAGTVGVALTHFNTKSVATMPLPLPPLREQQRIVAKVDELLAACDRLDAQLEAGRAVKGALLEVTLRDALSDREPAPTLAAE